MLAKITPRWFRNRPDSREIGIGNRTTKVERRNPNLFLKMRNFRLNDFHERTKAKIKWSGEGLIESRSFRGIKCLWSEHDSIFASRTKSQINTDWTKSDCPGRLGRFSQARLFGRSPGTCRAFCERNATTPHQGRFQLKSRCACYVRKLPRQGWWCLSSRRMAHTFADVLTFPFSSSPWKRLFCLVLGLETHQALVTSY